MKRFTRRKIILIALIIVLGGLIVLYRPTSQGSIIRIDAEQAAFSPTGNHMILITKKGVQIMNNINEDALLLTSSVKSGPITRNSDEYLAWHPSNAYIALSGNNDQIEVWDVLQRQKIASLSGVTYAAQLLAFSPDGTLLAAIDQDEHLFVWRWQDKKLLWRDEANAHNILAFNASGDRIITGYKIYNATNGLVTQEYGDITSFSFQCGAIEPYREIVANCDIYGKVDLINLKQHKIQQTFQALDGAANSAAFSADGRMLAIGNGMFESNPVSSTAIKVFDIQTEREIWSIPFGQIVQVERLQFSSDNRHLMAVVNEAPFIFLKRTSVYIWNIPAP